MGLAIYKPGQGYWTRVLSAVGFGALIFAGAGWIYTEASVVESPPFGLAKEYFQAGLAVAVLVVFGGLLYFVLNKPKFADFMIATEVEMKKVHWPTWPEIRRNTMVVIIGTLILAGLLMLFDFFFGIIATRIGLLES